MEGFLSRRKKIELSNLKRTRSSMWKNATFEVVDDVHVVVDVVIVIVVVVVVVVVVDVVVVVVVVVDVVVVVIVLFKRKLKIVNIFLCVLKLRSKSLMLHIWSSSPVSNIHFRLKPSW